MFCLLFRKFPYRISSDVLNILYSRCLFQCVVFNEHCRKCVNIYDLCVIRRFLFYVSHLWQMTSGLKWTRTTDLTLIRRAL